MKGCLPALRKPVEDDDETVMDDYTMSSSISPHCHLAILTTNDHHESVLMSSSGHQYRFLDCIKKSIFGQVLRAEILTSTLTPPSSSRLRSRGDSISTYASDDDHLDLSLDDEDLLPSGDSPRKLFASHGEHKNIVAIKIYSRARMSSPSNKNCKEDPSTELEISQFVANHHAHLLGSIECCANEDFMFNVMPYAPYPELFDFLADHQRFSESDAKDVMKQIFDGLSYLHHHQIAHRDISLENILFNPQDHKALIIDFGLGVLVGDNDVSFTSSKRTAESRLVPNILTGKVTYLPPEIIGGQPMIDPFAADIWACGICLLYLLLGFPPLVRAHPSDLRFVYLQTGKLSELIAQWGIDDISPATLSFVEFLLAIKSTQRPTIDAVMAHPWLR